MLVALIILVQFLVRIFAVRLIDMRGSGEAAFFLDQAHAFPGEMGAAEGVVLGDAPADRVVVVTRARRNAGPGGACFDQLVFAVPAQSDPGVTTDALGNGIRS